MSMSPTSFDASNVAVASFDVVAVVVVVVVVFADVAVGKVWQSSSSSSVT